MAYGVIVLESKCEHGWLVRDDFGVHPQDIHRYQYRLEPSYINAS